MNNIKVLIADDDPTVCYVAKTYMSSKGYKMYIAYDGEEAMQKMREVGPDIILLDIDMPKKTGYEVCEEIKNSDEFNATIVIIVTGDARAIERSFDLGADDCYLKPVVWSDLAERITELLEENDK
ncbi:response regulator [Elusimicrobiota bacterium]